MKDGPVGNRKREAKPGADGLECRFLLERRGIQMELVVVDICRVRRIDKFEIVVIEIIVTKNGIDEEALILHLVLQVEGDKLGVFRAITACIGFIAEKIVPVVVR
jgi:hypothetical protein